MAKIKTVAWILVIVAASVWYISRGIAASKLIEVGERVAEQEADLLTKTIREMPREDIKSTLPKLMALCGGAKTPTTEVGELRVTCRLTLPQTVQDDEEFSTQIETPIEHSATAIHYIDSGRTLDQIKITVWTRTLGDQSNSPPIGFEQRTINR